MKISASVKSTTERHEVLVSTAGNAQSLEVPMKSAGKGSSVNGGEFLMLALATCYCNDIYREAARMSIQVTSVEVEATADFEGIGLAANNVRYSARIESNESQDRIEQLLRETDAVAEIQNTVRSATKVTLVPWGATDAACIAAQSAA